MSSAAAIPMYLQHQALVKQLSFYISLTLSLSVSCLFDYVRKCCFERNLQGQILKPFLFYLFLYEATLPLKSKEVNAE